MKVRYVTALKGDFMGTTLHDSMEGWLAARKGHIPFWKLTENGQVLLGHTGDVKFLIATANKYLGKDDFKKMTHIPFEHLFGYALGCWMARFVDKGFTSQMLKDLRKELSDVRFFHILNPAIPSRGEPLPHWEFVADMEDMSDPEVTAAYAFSHQLTLDGFVGLKRCGLSNCKRFFIGRPDAKWCSNACGSRYRVGQKRKRDKSEW